MPLAPRLESYLEPAVGNASSVLDVGCGANSPIGRFGRRIPYSVGVDAFRPAIEASRRTGLHSEYRELDIRHIEAAFEPDSFDVVVAFDVLEHLDPEDGLELLASMEKIARYRVIVLTPNGFLRQDVSDRNDLQEHRSGWSAEYLRKCGYDVRGLHGWRLLRGEKGSPRWRPGRIWGLVSDLTQPIVYRVPELAFHLLAMKNPASASSSSTSRTASEFERTLPQRRVGDPPRPH